MSTEILPMRLYPSFKQKLINEGANFEVETTKSGLTYKINCEEGSFLFTNEKFSFSFFALLKQIKKEVLENMPIVPDTKNVLDRLNLDTYVQFNPKYTQQNEVCPIGHLISNVYEIDINSAYIHAALKLGYVSQKTFEKVAKLKKNERLVILGMIASVKRIETYENGNLNDASRLVYNPTLVQAFKNIVSYVGETITKMYLQHKNRTIFYWVDALFIVAPTIVEIQQIGDFCKEYGFTLKIKPDFCAICVGGKYLVLDYTKQDLNLNENPQKLAVMNLKSKIREFVMPKNTMPQRAEKIPIWTPYYDTLIGGFTKKYTNRFFDMASKFADKKISLEQIGNKILIRFVENSEIDFNDYMEYLIAKCPNYYIEIQYLRDDLMILEFSEKK